MNMLKNIRMAKHESDFKVVIDGGEEGLARLVNSATSRQKTTIMLADTQMPEPIERVEVYVKAGVGSIVGHSGYSLDAKLVPCAGQRLPIKRSSFSGFEVSKSSNYYILHSPRLPDHSSIGVHLNWPGNDNGIQLRHFATYGRGTRLLQQEVGEGITAFAMALEATINSVYRSAGKPAPKNPLVLQQLYRT